ncbi:MAG: hypothetical protein R2865_01390 [Deinococcales bacterium]
MPLRTPVTALNSSVTMAFQKPLLRLDSHTMSLRAPQILAEYNTIAFISDAGSPGISDPGEDLVRIALARGDKVGAARSATAFMPGAGALRFSL